MRVTRVLHHASNVTGRLQPCVAFYREVLGLADDARPEIPGVGGHWFGVGGEQLHLVDADPGPTGIRPTAPHVCLAVDDIDRAAAELEAAGVPCVRGAQGPTAQIWIVDPAGNTVELQQDPATRAGPDPADP